MKQSGSMFVAAILLATIGTPAPAQDAAWPVKPVRFIVSAPAGSAGDTISRIVAHKLGEKLGQQFVIDNRVGAGGSIANDALARSAPDGYTIGLVTTSTWAVAPVVNPELPYDPIKDFTPLSMIGASPYVLAVYPGVAAKTIGELVALAKAKSGPLSNGTFGPSSLGFLAGALFAHRTGVELNQVSYRSSAQAVVDLVAGRIDMQFGTLAPSIPLLRENKLRPLGTTGRKRVPALPDVPTIAEQGLDGYEVTLWMGIAAPAGVRSDIVQRFNAEMTKILGMPDVQKALEAQGMEAEPGPAQSLFDRLRDDLEKYRDIAKRAGIVGK